MAKKAAGCVRKKIVIKRKSGKIVKEFMGRTGAACGPRPKPKTAHLRVFQQAMASASRSCKRKNLSRGAFLNCVATQMPRSTPPRARR